MFGFYMSPPSEPEPVPADIDAETEPERVEAWRMLCLLNAGWDEPRAQLLAVRQDIDLHLAVHVLELGCGQKLGLKILL